MDIAITLRDTFFLHRRSLPMEIYFRIEFVFFFIFKWKQNQNVYAMCKHGKYLEYNIWIYGKRISYGELSECVILLSI